MSKKIISFITSLSVMFSLLSFLPNKLLINIIASAYNASAAVSYANTYWSNYNPNYSNYNSIGGDCANFVSQCLVAGGMQMTDGWYWYSYDDRSASWSACASMYNYFKNSGYEIIENPSDSQVIEGNPVLYYSSSKGRWSHAAICTGHDSSGNALVSAHNSDRHNVNWKLGTNWSKRCTIIINGDDPNPDMVIPTISTDKSSYIVGDTVNVSWAASPSNSNLEHYWITVYAPSGTLVNETMALNTSYSFVASEIGDYTIITYATPHNSPDGSGSLTDTRVISVASAIPKGQEMSNGAGQTLPDGDYYIISSINMNYYVDIPGTEVASGNNVNMYTMGTNVMPPACDAWTLVYLGNGFYKIKSKGTNFCLDVSGASLDRGANVQVWEENDSTAQQWSIIQTDYGYKIQSRCNGFYLDVAGGGFENSTNVQVWETNDTTAQKYVFVPYGASTGQTIEDGVYSIRSALDANYCVDADGAAVKSEYKDETNIHLWETNTCDDLFYVEYLSDGYYNVSEVSTGLALDVWNDDANFTYVNRNIQLCGKNGNRNQQWVIKDNGDGTYTLISKMSGYCLDLSGGVCEKGKNISQYYYNGTAAQKWSFVPVSPSEIIIKNPPTKTEYYIGEQIDSSGISVQLTYAIGTFKDVSHEVSYQYDFSEIGNADVIVSYAANGSTFIDSFTVTVKNAPFKGKGTEDDPYLISSKKDLQVMRDLINDEASSSSFRACVYLQTTDIDLEDEEWIPIGKRAFDGTETSRLFAGHYNGNHHTIFGLSINETSKYAGLFGSIGIKPAIIENLAVEGTVNSTDISVGGICGEICGKNGIIRNCSFIGNVSGGEQAVGGVVGYIWQSGSVIDCYHNGTVTSNGGRIIGGVVGNIHTGGSEDSNTVLIQNCYHVGTLSGASDATGTIAGIVSVDTQHESIITIENCYALQGEGNAIGSGKANTQDITLLKSALMKAAASSLGSAYKENTDSSFNGGYPIFNWQNSVVGDCNNDGVFTIADIVMVQKWLLNDGTVLDNWKAADLYGDNVINVFDLVLMKQMIVNIK